MSRVPFSFLERLGDAAAGALHLGGGAVAVPARHARRVAVGIDIALEQVALADGPAGGKVVEVQLGAGAVAQDERRGPAVRRSQAMMRVPIFTFRISSLSNK